MIDIRRYYCLILSLFLLFLILPSLAKAETLEEAWRTALAANQSLQASRKMTESAQQNLAAAKGARLPGLTVQSGYTVLDNEPAFKVDLPPLPPKELPFAEDKFFWGSAMVTLPLFTSGRISRSIDAANAGLNAARMDETRTTLDLKMAVAEAYVGVLRATRAVNVAEINVAGLAAHAKDVDNLFKQEFVAKNDVLATQVALADARQRSLQANNALDITKAVYNRLLGRPLTQPVELDEPSTEPLQTDIDTLTNRGVDHRPELKLLSEQSQSLRHQAAGVRASTWPQIAFGGGYSFLQNQFLAHEGIWSATVGLKWDIFDGGVRRSQAAALEQKAEAFQKQRSDAASIISLQVRQTWLDVGETQRRLEVTREAVAQSDENLKVAKDRYRNGLGTNTEVLDAETLRVRSHSNHDNAIYDHVLASLRLRRAVGDL